MTQHPACGIPVDSVYAFAAPPPVERNCSCASDELDQQRDQSIQWLADILCGAMERAEELDLKFHIVPDADGQPGFEMRWSDRAGEHHSIHIANGAAQVHLVDDVERMSAQLDTVYTDRTEVLNLLSAVFPAFLTDAPEAGTGWKILYMRLLNGAQASWPIRPRDVHILADVPHTDKITWDGHTTQEKNDRMGQLAESLRFGFAEGRYVG